MLEITAETKSQDNKNQVGNKRSQIGNKGDRRLETKETKSSAEITRSQIFKGKKFKNYFHPLPWPPSSPCKIIFFPSGSPLRYRHTTSTTIPPHHANTTTNVLNFWL